MKKKILIAPLNWGLGHATRCIPIIKALEENGFEPIIASDGVALALLKKEFPNLFMIKEACPNINQYFDILRTKPEGFSLVSGDDEYALPVTLAGGDGVISVIGQGYPKEFSTMLQLAFEGKIKEAYQIHNKLVEITRLIFAEGNPCGIKTVLAEKGIIKNYLRLPLVAASECLQTKIKAEMAKI